MAEQNVEIVRRVFEAFNRRDAASILRDWQTEAEWRPSISPGGIEGNVYVGHDGVRRWLDELAESWESFEAFDLKLELVGDGVVVRGRVRVCGRASGAEIERELGQVWELEDGKARRVTGYLSHADALEAARRSE